MIPQSDATLQCGLRLVSLTWGLRYFSQGFSALENPRQETSLQQRLVKTGGRPVKHAPCYSIFPITRKFCIGGKHMKIWRLLPAAILVCAACAVQAGTLTIANPSFETDVLGWQPVRPARLTIRLRIGPDRRPIRLALATRRRARHRRFRRFQARNGTVPERCS